MRIVSSFSKSGKGSILLELAVGISVLAVLSGFIIRKTISAKKHMREQITKVNINTTVTAIAAFVANNNRLPRPSEDTNGNEGAFGVKFGYVPYKILGISEKIAKDGDAKPLTYLVEPTLTSDFPRIYKNESDENCFCKNIVAPAIKIFGYDSENVIAFVVDTKDHSSSGNTITPSVHTVWISRDMLLMKYLKNSPCRRENAETHNPAPDSDFDNNF